VIPYGLSVAVVVRLVANCYTPFTYLPDRCAEYCDERVSVCVFARMPVSTIRPTSPNLDGFFVKFGH